MDAFVSKCKEEAAEYYNGLLVGTDHPITTPQDVYVVWCCKTLRNSKVFLSIPFPEPMCFELTYNDDEEVIYFNAYKKTDELSIDIREGDSNANDEQHIK